MATYYADIEYTTVVTVRFDLPDDVEPTEQDAFDAAAYVDNHVDSNIYNEKVVSIEKDPQ